ncbi:MAG: glycosyltransferase family 4 protein [Proteobacteria bacterium]|nr:glycosyltransferase family 4 protein [Pseudomonadota bacterium]
MTQRFHIAMRIEDGPTGGGNQFLKALRGELDRGGLYAHDPLDADVVLFNSFQDIGLAADLRRKLPRAIFVHRADGVTRLYNRPEDRRDLRAIAANRLLADGTVFQSEWCRTAHFGLGWPADRPHTVIVNAPDPAIFRAGAAKAPPARPRVIVTSWSNNPNKGADVLEWLESNAAALPFDVTFVGNAPRPLAGMRCLPPMASAELADTLRSHDVFLMPARRECCSNALIEAMACGLPAVARNDGGNPEIVGDGGVLFDTPDQLASCIMTVAGDHARYRRAIAPRTLADVAARYVAFARDLAAHAQTGASHYRRFGASAALWAKWRFGRF